MESRRWSTAHNTDTQDTSLGLHVADLPTLTLESRNWAHLYLPLV
jgi:hypothetical protein